jgi:hypothetical protein
MRLKRSFAGLGIAGLIAVFGLLLLTTEIHAQGITTAAVAGRVTDDQGAPIENIIVQVTNASTGVVSGGITDENGEYFVAGLQIGGPYTVEASGLGYGAESNTVPRLTLGQRLVQNFQLAQEAVEVAGIVAVAPTVNEIINPSRTGQETLVSEHAIANLPSLGRNFTDFVESTPLSGAGGQATSVGAQNNRFNNIQIDGVVTQDVFGLGATGQPGGQAGARSISIEAVKEYQVIAAPFDVRQSGFTGGLINAVTKTGTNEWQATGYYYHRDESLVREELLESTFGEFTNTILGGTFAGPIVRDRVHFFLSGEHEKNERPGGDVIVGREDPAMTHVAVEDVEGFVDLLSDKGVTAGGFGPFTVNNPNDNIFGRIDAQLNPNHTLTLRHNWVQAEDDVVVNRGGFNTYSLDSNFYFFETETNSTVAQLNSTFADRFYNELTGGYTRIRDRRTPVTTYPEINVIVDDADGSGTTTLRAGAELFSQGNELDQDTWEIQDALSFNVGEHRLTFGIQDQAFKFRNLFLAGSTGSWTFSSLEDFDAGTPSSFTRSVPFAEDFDPNARFTVNNLALYGQSEYRGIENVVLTGGLRYDKPFVLDDPIENPDVEAAFGIRTDDVPSNGILSPRFGFNWDVYGDQTTQFRGGAGLFTGRQPFVWLSNLYSNTGRAVVSFTCRASDGNLPAFTFDPGNQPENCTGVGIPPPSRAVINLIDEDFEFPNAWRFDVAVDRELPWWGIVGTAEVVYTKYRNQIFLEEINVDKTPVSFTQGNRPVFGTHKPGLDNDAQGRPTNNNDISLPNFLHDEFFQTVLLTNSDQDRAWNFILQAQKRYSDGIEFNASYTFNDAEDISGLTSSIATSNIGFNPVAGNPNDPPLATSNYQQTHKVVLGGSFDVTDWFTWSMVYVGNSGDKYTYVYNGDVNADAFEFTTASDRVNDLLYVPTGPDDITLVDPADWDELNSYIETEACLAESRGEIIARNVCDSPWRNRLDTRLTFKIPTIAGQHGELVWDIFNVGNLLNEDWGRSSGVTFGTIELLALRGWDEENNRGIFDINRLNVGDDGAADPFTVFDTASRWQMQFGVRYALN